VLRLATVLEGDASRTWHRHVEALRRGRICGEVIELPTTSEDTLKGIG